jgi:glycosyltransferase involved in cell wall biosynthesis
MLAAYSTIPANSTTESLSSTGAHGAVLELEIVFWQRIVTIHQAPLIAALAALPDVKVTYVAEEMISDSRQALGWSAPSLGTADLVLVDSPQAIAALLPRFSAQAIHICQGIRDNGLVGVAQQQLRRRNARVLILAEAVDDHGWGGFIKRFWYELSLRRVTPWVDTILTIGEQTPHWFAARGFPRSRIFPFCYFLDVPANADVSNADAPGVRPFHIVFIGNFIPRKRLDLLIESLGMLANEVNFKLTVIGSGPLENEWRRLAVDRLGERVVWQGLLPAAGISPFLAGVDCLVLPSWHDGWGAVVSEALLVGTPVICSDRCGAAVAVRRSRAGGVFRSGDRDTLTACVLGVMARGIGRTPERAHLAAWARRSLGGTAGARYLVEILRHRFAGAQRPFAPMLDPRF